MAIKAAEVVQSPTKEPVSFEMKAFVLKRKQENIQIGGIPSVSYG